MMPDRTAIFEDHRSRLTALAYRMLGSISEAEDVVQDAFLRWMQADGNEIRVSEAWIVSATARICIDRLRRLAAERAAYSCTWLPEPIIGGAAESPEYRLDRASDLSMAFLIVLERLSPDERAIFILHDVFDASFAEIGSILGKSEVACRQTARRARHRVRQDRPRFRVDEHARRRLVEKFLDAMQSGDRATLMEILADDAVLTSDGGGKTRVARSGIHGADRIARLVTHSHLVPRRLRAEADRVARKTMLINGDPGIVTFLDGRPIAALAFHTNGLRILAIYQVLDPDKLTRVTLPGAPAGVAGNGWFKTP
jgi:RNA polymerase sigma-70 factor, ECF subfamily